MSRLIASFVIGALFGLGLIVSQMINPSKVIGFLDFAGSWDPSLALVMAGAIAVGAIGFALIRKTRASKQRSLLGETLHLPNDQTIDRRLIGGSALFGIGWGLAGFCPAPAIVGASMGNISALIFIIALISGMALFEIAEQFFTPTA